MLRRGRLVLQTSNFSMASAVLLKGGRLVLQMGGPEGVYSREVSRMTVAIRGGLQIQFHPRLPAA